MKILNNLVSGYFDLAEINALEHRPMYMSDYVEQLDSILSSGNRKLLTGAGKVSHDEAMKKAKEEYKKYQAITLSPVEQAYMETIKDAGESAKKGLGNKHFSLVICSQGKNVNYIDVKFPPLFISLPEILLWKKLKSSGLQITMWSIRFENIETIIKGEVQYPRLKFVLIIETIRLLIRHTGYIKEKHEEIPKQRGSIGHISGK